MASQFLLRALDYDAPITEDNEALNAGLSKIPPKHEREADVVLGILFNG
jgi:hypothetical protein